MSAPEGGAGAHVPDPPQPASVTAAPAPQPRPAVAQSCVGSHGGTVDCTASAHAPPDGCVGVTTLADCEPSAHVADVHVVTSTASHEFTHTLSVYVSTVGVVQPPSMAPHVHAQDAGAKTGASKPSTTSTAYGGWQEGGDGATPPSSLSSTNATGPLK